MNLKMMRISFLFLIVMLSLASCSVGNRLLETQQIVEEAKRGVGAEREIINATQQAARERLADGGMESTIKGGYDELLNQLNADLEKVEQRIAALEAFVQDKGNFRGAKYEDNVVPEIAVLDSFNTLKQKREKIYNLITEAIATRAFNLFNLAAFFDPGVYRIPDKARAAATRAFSPVLDSIQYLANKYSSIPRTARIVFVGFADESPIAEGSKLYNELRRFLKEEQPTRANLNSVLSQLRANEMMHSMKQIVNQNTAAFKSPATLQINYHNYGRGESYPNPKIKDYKKDDERRRIVMVYWSVLPDIHRLQ